MPIIAGVVLSERLAVTMYGAIHRASFGGQRNLGIALGTGVAGGIISLGDSRDWAVDHSVTWVFALALVGAVGGLLAAGRMPSRVPAQAT